MRIIPVIDIMGGVAVHAKGGQRYDYKPIKSQLCETSNPIDLALALRTKFGFRELYIADLDSIMGRGDNMDMLRRIYEYSSMKIMVDSGIDDVKKARELLHVGVEKVVVGTETLTGFEVLKKILNFSGHERIIVSIDMKNGEILSKCKEIVRLSPEALVKRLKSMGIKELILLDLSRIGSESGVNIELIRRVLSSVDIPIITGGGIRNIDDVLLLRDLGISGVLISTALH
ncbi:MAG: HisA/HisF family protein, partial [archaeon]|nr:HisA/HisF family protein [archaeon]